MLNVFQFSSNLTPITDEEKEAERLRDFPRAMHFVSKVSLGCEGMARAGPSACLSWRVTSAG